jgi:hypothetical protein
MPMRKDLDLQGLSYYLMETLEGPALAANPRLERLTKPKEPSPESSNR